MPRLKFIPVHVPPPSTRKKSAAIRFSVSLAHPEAHVFEVTCRVDAPAAAGQKFSLPAWIPGSYMIREFARNIVSIEASCKGRTIALTKIDKDTWQAAPCAHALTLTYRVYAWDLSVRCAHLDTTHAFFNGTALFLRVPGQEQIEHIVEIQKPRGVAHKNWRVATALPSLAAKPHGFGTYRAENYDALIDHPVEIGSFALGHFIVRDKAGREVVHEIAITGPVPQLDMAHLCADMQSICAAQIRFFEPRSAEAPFERYVFLVMALGDGSFGGLEHRASTALICARNDLPVLGKVESSKGYRSFLGLVSHEYFHSWNVKRIKPAAFAPYDLQSENHTTLLWIFEGFTSYYDDLFLLRTKHLGIEQYLNILGKTITTVLRGSGRSKQSVAESSFDAWTKYYRQDENAPNALVSYYQKGSLVALALDLHLRSESKNKKSLDDVMRLLWKKYGRDFYATTEVEGRQRGLGEEEFATIVHAATGIDVRREVAEWAYGTRDLPLASLLKKFGIAMRLQPEHDRPTLGIKTAFSQGECRITQVHDHGSAQAAGLSAGDVLVAIDGLQVKAQSGPNLDALLGRYGIGAVVSVHVFRREQLLAFQLKLGAEAATLCKLNVESGQRNSTEAGNYAAWIKGL